MRLFPLRRRGALGLAATTAVISAAVLTACTATEPGHGSVRSTPGQAAPGTSSSPPPAAVGKVAKFGPCGTKSKVAGGQKPPADRQGKLRYSCAVIAVPLDHAKPTGPAITLQLIKVHYTGATGQKPLLLNRGGPGAAGVDFAIDQAYSIPLPVLEHYDLVGFDPRGIGASTPLRCFDTKQKDALNSASPDMRTAAGFAQAKALATKFAQACSKKDGSRLPYFNTVQTAEDMDSIRQALGQSRTNYLGFSYGTELGAQYAHLFPSRVGAFVLDGAVDPLTDPLTSYTNQLQGFEDAFDQFSAWCTKHSPCRQLGDPRKAVYSIFARTKSAPMTTSIPGETRKLTPTLAATGVLQALYSQSLWAPLGEGLLLAQQRGDGNILLQLADLYNERTHGQYTNIYDANAAISCNDEPPGPSDAQIRSTTKSWLKRFPLFGPYNAPTLFQCQVWQPKRTILPRPTAKNSATTVLVIGNIHDPATPYRGTKDLAETLGNARILTWNGEGHTSFEQGSSCVDASVAAYLDTSRPPAAGKRCPA